MMGRTYPVDVDFSGKANLDKVQVAVPAEGADIWMPVIQHAATRLGVRSSDIRVCEVIVDGSKRPRVEVARPLADALLKQEVRVVIEQVEEYADRTTLAPATEMVFLKLAVAELKAGLQDTRTELQNFKRLSYKVGRRSLVEQVREKILGHPLSNEDKSSWNNYIANVIPDDQLEEHGLSRKQLRLTKFGANSLQKEGSSAAHQVPIEIVAGSILESVKYNTPAHVALFEFVYGYKPGEVVDEDDDVEDE